MLLVAELILILVLVTCLIVLVIEEGKAKRAKVSKGSMREYWDGSERRQSMRVTMSLVVRYSVEKKYHIKVNGHMDDVSSGGMRLTASEKLPEGSLLLLEFELPEQKNAVFAEGKVIWSEGKFEERDTEGKRVFQTGIQFANMLVEDRKRLLACIKNLSNERQKKA